MTEDEVNAEIGKLITRYRDRLKEHAALRNKTATLVGSMREVVDAAFAGDRFTPTAIPRTEIPDDGWNQLGGLLDTFYACRADLADIENDLRSAKLEDLIQRY